MRSAKPGPSDVSLARLRRDLGGISERKLDRLIRDAGLDETHIRVDTLGRRIVQPDAYEETLALLRGVELESGTVDEPESYSYSQERARREHYAARREKLRYLRESGDLMKRDEVRALIASTIGGLRQRMLELPRQICAELANQDAVTVEHGLKAAIRDILEAVKDD